MKTDILSKLRNVKPIKGGYMASCPVPSHGKGEGDRNPSLSITFDSDRILLYCFAGCSTEQIVSSLGLELRDLFTSLQNKLSSSQQTFVNGNDKPELDSERFEKTNVESELANPVASYYYYDEDENGEPVLRYQVLRFEPKRFCFKPSGIEKHLPYRLLQLLRGIREGKSEIWLAEGQKDADTLAWLGFLASDFRFWNSDCTERLERELNGKKLDFILCVDHDSAGFEHARRAIKHLAPIANSFKIIDLYENDSELHGKDVTDWFNANFDSKQGFEAAEKLKEKAKTAKVITNLKEWIAEENRTESLEQSKQAEKNKPKFVPISEICQEPEQDIRFIWQDVLPTGGFSVLTGKPKVGKSTFVRNLAVAVSRGEPFLERETVKGRVLYFCLEEKPDEIKRHFTLMQAQDSDVLIYRDLSLFRTTENFIQILQEAIVEYEPILVIIDPLVRVVRNADFNDYSSMSYALEQFVTTARKFNTHVLVLHHEGKAERNGGDAILGSTAIFGSVDCHIQIKKREQGRTISTTQRYGKDLEEVVIELNEETGLIVPRGALQTVVLEDIKEEILNVLNQGEMLTQAEIKERVGKAGGIVSKAINELFKEGKLYREGEGKKGNPFLFGKVESEKHTSCLDEVTDSRKF